MRGEKKKKVAQISPNAKLTQTLGLNLGVQKLKGRKNTKFEGWEKETSNTIRCFLKRRNGREILHK